MRRLLILLFVFAGTIAGRPLHAQERVALIIGNSQYRDGGTRSLAAGDAAAIAKMLTGMDFEVTLGTDLDHDGMVKLQEQFQRSLDRSKLALYFFLGRGIQVGGNNFLLPVDAKPTTMAALSTSTMPLDAVVKQMAAASRVSLIILDMDRTNPLSPSEPGAAVPSGLGAVPPENVLIVFSTSPGTELPASTGPNSALVTAILNHLPTPDITFDEVMKRVRHDVAAATEGRQLPAEFNSLGSEVILLPTRSAPAAKP